jgi:hypothetical protein
VRLVGVGGGVPVTQRLTTLLFGVGIMLASVATGDLVTNNQFVRFAFAACLGALVVGFGIRAPRPALYGTIIWLAALGLVRRLLSHATAGPGSIDPLLLTEPVALAMLLFSAAEHTAFRLRTKLSDAILVLVAFIVLGAINPLQGSLFAGFSALIFFTPISAFWIGRTLSDATFKRALFIYAICAIPAALYGMYQITSGFPSWDQTWINQSGYGALQVAGTIRPFSSFSSAAEYATFMAISIVIWLVLGRRALRPVAFAAIALLGVSVFYQSSRGTVVTIAAAFALIAGARRGFPLFGAVVIGAALLAVLPFAAQQLAPSSYGTSAQADLAQHEISGLANPFDASQSTAGVHIKLVIGGVEAAFRNPIGEGISTVTIAGKKFGGIASNSEADVSNAAIAMGMPGLLGFLAVLFIGFRRSYRLAALTRDPLAITALGILTVTIMQWLNGGQYAVAFVPWLMLGWVDAKTELLATAQPADPELEAPAPVELPRAPRREPGRLRLEPLPSPATRVAPALDLELAPEIVETAPEPEPVFRATYETPPPREWEIRQLEYLVDSIEQTDPERSQALRDFLVELRPYAAADGRLALALDPVVREQFGDLIEGRFA